MQRPRIATIGLAAAAAGLVLLAIVRLSFDVDPLDLLPQDRPEVVGLRELQNRFGEAGSLIVTLGIPEGDPADLAAAAGDLAVHLRSIEGLVEKVDYRPPEEADPAGAAGFPAYLWLNAEPATVDALIQSLSPEQIDAHLQSALEQLAFGIDGEQIALAAYDPLGLLDCIPGALDAGGLSGANRFAAADGTFRALYVTAPEAALGGYREAERWVGLIRSQIETWRSAAGQRQRIAIGITGEPAFEGEIGTGMERDMSGSLIGATVLIHLLFALMYRRFLPLVAIFFGLVVVLSLTVVTGSLTWGSLSVMSVGFAAILVGLTVDYGVVIYSEAQRNDRSLGEFTRLIRVPVWWAAITTAAVFSSLALSALPGVRQLGGLVAIGILIGALVMLGTFTPLAWRWCRPHHLPHDRIDAPVSRGGRRGMLWPTGIALALALSLIAARGLPGFEPSLNVLRPSQSSADRAFAELERRLMGEEADRPQPLLLVASDREALAVQARALSGRLAASRAAGDLDSSVLLPELVPSVSRQSINAPKLRSLSARRSEVLAALERAGFALEGQALAVGVFDAWDAMFIATDLPHLPEGATARALLRNAYHEGEGSVALLGAASAREGSAPGALAELAAEFPNCYATGWQVLGPTVRELVVRDLRAVFLPMAVVLVLMLVLVFRNLAEALLAMGVIAFSAALLLASMALFGWGWDLLNVCAFPLLLGMGIDYTIHMIFALRRCGGDVREARAGTGKALFFCGCSTALGFGSLAFADNGGVASLGRVCALGILIVMAAAILLLPTWWQRGRHDGHPS